MPPSPQPLLQIHHIPLDPAPIKKAGADLKDFQLPSPLGEGRRWFVRRGEGRPWRANCGLSIRKIQAPFEAFRCAGGREPSPTPKRIAYAKPKVAPPLIRSDLGRTPALPWVKAPPCAGGRVGARRGFDGLARANHSSPHLEVLQQPFPIALHHLRMPIVPPVINLEQLLSRQRPKCRSDIVRPRRRIL